MAYSHSVLNAIGAENVLRLSSSTFHNIGNVVTVAKLALENLRSLNSCEAVDFILNEILPATQSALEEGRLQSFFKDDPQGQHYFSALQELLQHQKSNLHEQEKQFAALDAKLKHIAEIVALQQRLTRNTGSRQIIGLQMIVDDALSMIAESLSRHNIKCVREYLKAPVVSVDSSMATQAIINVLKNAVEALDTSSDDDRQITLTVDSCIDNARHMAVCRVRDNGPGMDSDTINRVFDFGFTTKAKTRGGGIGLYYCRRMAEEFDGRIEIDADTGHGTTVSIFLPEEDAE